MKVKLLSDGPSWSSKREKRTADGATDAKRLETRQQLENRRLDRFKRLKLRQVSLKHCFCDQPSAVLALKMTTTKRSLLRETVTSAGFPATCFYF